MAWRGMRGMGSSELHIIIGTTLLLLVFLKPFLVPRDLRKIQFDALDIYLGENKVAIRMSSNRRGIELK